MSIDWGAIATYAALATKPEMIERAAVIAVAHPSTFPVVLGDPAQAHRGFHVWYLVQEGIEEVVRATDFALVDYLWQLWSPAGRDDSEHVERVKRETLAPEGALEAAVSYYRALVRLRFDPDAVTRLSQPVSTPMLAIFGSEDPAALGGDEASFSGPYRREVVEHALHFVHRERPEVTTRLLLEWLAAGSREAVAAP